MHLPRAASQILQGSPLISDDHLYISGDVTLDPSAAIAPNVLLQADPGCRLVIAAGVSIGSGCVLHAHNGTLEIDTGATLGSGVLVVGSGKIGANACIGSRATIMDSSIAPEYVVPPKAIIGDPCGICEAARSEAPVPQSPPPVETPAVTPASTNGSAPTAQNANGKKPVYGQVYLERMMVMMFPHQPENQKLQNQSPDD
jgi:carbon dioxide concentrating mechanism protein CcmN